MESACILACDIEKLRLRLRLVAGVLGAAITTLARRPCLGIRNASLPTPKSLLLDLYYASAIKLLKMSLRGARHCEAVLALRSCGKSLSTELWILLASWRVTLKNFVASTMRTCLLTTRAVALAPVCSGVFLVCVCLPPSLQLTSTISVSLFCVSPPVRLLSQRLRLRLRLRLEGEGVG